MSSDAAPHASSLSFLLSQVGAERAASFARVSAQVGVTPRGYAVLAVLSTDYTPSQQQLADRLGIHRNNMVALIDDLESRGLVERRRDPADRRAFRLHRTSSGSRTVTRIGRFVAELDAELETLLARAQVETLRALMESLASGLGLQTGIHPSLHDSPGT